MVDQTFPTDRPADSVCPWCSAAVTPDTAICPSCGAILISDEQPELPGVTEVDQAIVRGEKKPAGRSRLLSWISGEYPEESPDVADPQALAPPDPEVQREILRLELEAEVANLQAESDALRSEAAAEGRDLPDGVEPFATSGGAVTAATATTDATDPTVAAPTPDEIAAPIAAAPRPKRRR
jgi:RNA polymerase subunit RPABC4/transcription elongation factor Spt4